MSGIGRGGTGVLKVDGKEVARQTMERTIPLILQWDENFDIGADTGTPVDDQDYQVPFRFTGKLDKLTLTIDRPKLTPADIEKLQAGHAQQPRRRVALRPFEQNVGRPTPGGRQSSVHWRRLKQSF